MTAPLTLDHLKEPTMDDVRFPVWLTHAQRSRLDAVLGGFISTVMLPAARTTIEGIRAEIGVAVARDHLWPDAARAVRAATGMPEDALPVLMSTHEKQTVLRLLDLDASTADPAVEALRTAIGQ